MPPRRTRFTRAVRLPMCSAVTLWLCAPATVSAAGYYTGPIGARAVGRAGAFVARADDLSAAFYNPAGFARLHGNLVQLDNKLGYGTLSYTRQATWNAEPPNDPRDEPPTPFDPVRNAEPWRLLGPLLGIGSDLGLRDWGFALVVYTPSNSSTMGYPLYGGQRYMMVNREALMFNTALSAAWTPVDKLSIGISAQALTAPSIVYELVVDANPSTMGFWPVSSPFDVLASIEVADLFTFTTIVGLSYRPTPYLEFGLSGQVIPTAIRAKGTLSVLPVNPDTLETLDGFDIAPEDAIALNRDGEPSNRVSLTMPVPLTARAGVRYIHRDGQRELFDIEVDVAYEGWSAVRNFELDSQGLTATFNNPAFPPTPLPISALNVPKHWRDTWTLAVGGDCALWQNTSLRLGTYYETPLASAGYANVDFPSGAHVGVTAGASLDLGAVKLGAAYEYRHMLDIELREEDARVRQLKPAVSDNPEAEFPVVNAGTYQHHTHNVVLSAAYQF